ncbi:MAG: SGNH/GDSL hydrolase family protein [Clostridia bacterium]|nr:SGNH/GDSL hydrolase family protein [Clostridia bacterium]
MLEYCKYDRKTYTLPIWEGNTVYNETLMFVGETEAPLLYYPDKVISVRSFDLKTEYVEGKDYVVQDGRIVLTDNTGIPSFSLEEYYPAEAVPGKCFGSRVEGHPYIFFSEGSTIFQRQIHVTYTHSQKWEGFLPQKSDRFQRFFEKAARGDEVTVLFFGDSITTGANSSGRVGCEPFAETWMEMIVGCMKEYFHNDKIKYVNTAVGGKATPWALETLKENAIDVNPDLMFLGFGMNDGGRAPEEEARLMNELLDRFVEACPDSDIALIAPMLPHFRLKGFWGNQPKFEAEFAKICKQRAHMDLIPVTSVHNAILQHKRYYDMTGNNVNHPNDFLARIYAQTALKVLFG